MTRKRVPAFDFAGARLFEPLSRTLMGLQLWHGINPSTGISLDLPARKADFQRIARSLCGVYDAIPRPDTRRPGGRIFSEI